MKILPEYYAYRDSEPATIDSLNQEKTELRALRLKIEKDAEIARDRHRQNSELVGIIIFAAIVILFFVK